MDAATRRQWERTWHITSLEATGALGICLDDTLLMLRWMHGWATRDQLAACLHDPHDATAYLAQLRMHLTVWLDWCDSTARLLAALGLEDAHTAQQATLARWRAGLMALLTALEQWDPDAALLPCLGWHIGAQEADDGSEI